MFTQTPITACFQPKPECCEFDYKVKRLKSVSFENNRHRRNAICLLSKAWKQRLHTFFVLIQTKNFACDWLETSLTLWQQLCGDLMRNVCLSQRNWHPRVCTHPQRTRNSRNCSQTSRQLKHFWMQFEKTLRCSVLLPANYKHGHLATKVRGILDATGLLLCKSLSLLTNAAPKSASNLFVLIWRPRFYLFVNEIQSNLHRRV